MSALQLTVAILLALAAGIGLLRSARSPSLRAAGAPRRAAILLLQPAVAGLLYLALFPPLQPHATGALTVLTGGIPRAELARWADRPDVVALPEVAAHPGLTRVPDLATALRQRPDAADLRLRGSGLLPRDRAAAVGRVTAFEPTSLPAGVVALDWPRRVPAGQPFALRGKIEGAGESLRAELLDSAGQPLADAAVDPRGAFTLPAIARTPGPLALTLRIRDGADAVRESLAVPLLVTAGDRPRVLLHAGAPGSELKFLRRWLVDSGAELHVRMLLTHRVALSGGQPALDAAALAGMDVVLLDERAWRALTPAQRSTLETAIRGGLGLLLRFTDAPTAADRARLAEWGFAVDTVDTAREVRLPGASVALSARSLEVNADDALPLGADADAADFARWRPLGQGRVGLWWLSDSFRLVLAGDTARHGQLWSAALATLARPRGAAGAPSIAGEARVGERAVLCGRLEGARVIGPTGDTTELAVDPLSQGCAGFWPRAAGWHGLDLADGTRDAFHVRADDEALGLAAAERSEATRRIAALSSPRGDAQKTTTPGPRWPWWLAWLAAATLLGLLERRREGPVGSIPHL